MVIASSTAGATVAERGADGVWVETQRFGKMRLCRRDMRNFILPFRCQLRCCSGRTVRKGGRRCLHDQRTPSLRVAYYKARRYGCRRVGNQLRCGRGLRRVSIQRACIAWGEDRLLPLRQHFDRLYSEHSSPSRQRLDVRGRQRRFDDLRSEPKQRVPLLPEERSVDRRRNRPIHPSKGVCLHKRDHDNEEESVCTPDDCVHRKALQQLASGQQFWVQR